MNIAVIFGGKSCEHNISIATGVMAANELKGRGHKVICIYVARSGKWKTSGSFFDVAAFRSDARGRRVYLKQGDNRLHYGCGIKKKRIDCALLCLHGKNGEDGSVQGLLQLCGIPYTGSDVLPSAVGMDKQMIKKLFKADKIPSLKCVVANAWEKRENILKKITFTLGYPVIVKPARAGSSIGISIAHDRQQLVDALNAAFLWDTKAVVERALTNFTELNCAVIGNCDKAQASLVEMPTNFSEFLTYNDKYHGKAKCGGGREFPAKVAADTENKVRSLAVQAFKCVGAEGVARIDFLLDNDSGKLYVNEINTIPGSMALYLFPEHSHAETLFYLIDLAIERKRNEDALRYVYDDKLLKKG